MRGSMIATAMMLAGAALVPPLLAQLSAQQSAERPQPKVEVKTADYDFSYSYPVQAAAIPALAAYFEADRARVRASLVKDAADARREAKQDGYSFNPYETAIVWDVVTQTQRLLSLSGSFYGFSGGAHGNIGSDSLVWDKQRRERLKPLALFTSPDALWAAIKQPYCQALDAERATRRGEAVSKSSDPFDTCPLLKELTLLLGSSNRQAINRIGLIADQYVAGSYAEGPYEITLPVTPAVIAAVRPGYRAGFAVGQ